MPTEPHDFTKKPIHVSSNNVKFAVVAVKLPAPPAVIVVDAFVAMLKTAFSVGCGCSWGGCLRWLGVGGLVWRSFSAGSASL